MKSLKSNIRSFRYSDRVAEILEAAEGSTLNEKFENLVIFCHEELPKVKKDVEMYKGLCADERRRYYKLSEVNRDFKGVIDSLQLAKQKLDRMVGADDDV